MRIFTTGRTGRTAAHMTQQLAKAGACARVAATLGIGATVWCSAQALAQTLPDGAVLFAQHCASCHQSEGQGTVGLAPALKATHWQRLGRDRGYLPQVLVHGLSGPIEVNGERHSGSMPAFAQLDDASLAALANHVQSHIQGRSDAPYTSADLRAAREAGGSPPQSRQRRVQALK